MSQYDPPAPPTVPQTPSDPRPNPYANPYAALANPYAPPAAQVGLSSQAPGSAEAVRREHLNHETGIRSIGTLYVWGGAVYVFVALVSVIAAIAQLTGDEGAVDSVVVMGVLIFAVLMAALFIWMGLGLRRLEEKVRMPATILSALGLLGFPLGTLINGYILFLLHSEKGKRIMSAEYRAIRDQTPHIKYGTPLWLWLLLGVFVLAFIGVLVAVFSS